MNTPEQILTNFDDVDETKLDLTAFNLVGDGALAVPAAAAAAPAAAASPTYVDQMLAFNEAQRYLTTVKGGSEEGKLAIAKHNASPYHDHKEREFKAQYELKEKKRARGDTAPLTHSEKLLAKKNAERAFNKRVTEERKKLGKKEVAKQIEKSKKIVAAWEKQKTGGSRRRRSNRKKRRTKSTRRKKRRTKSTRRKKRRTKSTRRGKRC
jgi:hypothetical protein